MTEHRTDSFFEPVPSSGPGPGAGASSGSGASRGSGATSRVVASTDAILPPGTELGKYEVIRFLAEGGMGVVYLAKHKALQSQHAIKVIRSAYASQKEFLSRFRREARIMAALEHPNVVRVTDFGEADGLCFYVMDYVPGPEGKPWTMEDEIKAAVKAGKTAGLPQRRVREIGLQICDALAYAHGFGKEGVAHLDLKPSNIMIVGHSATRGVRTAVKVTDFGFAKILDRNSMLSSIAYSQTTTTGTDQAMIAGTPRYMSPEQWRGETAAGPASDIYALGTILYESLVGKVPQEVYPARPPSAFGCADDWDRIVERCLRNEPERRYPSADKLRDEIEKIRFIKPVSTGRKTARRAVVGLSVLGALLVVGAILYFSGVIDEPTITRTTALAKSFYGHCQRRMNALLKPPGFLNVRSDAGVEIVILPEGGQEMRIGPTDMFGHKSGIRLAEGTYRIVLTRDGFEPVTNRIVVVPGEIKTLERKIGPTGEWTRPPLRVEKAPVMTADADPGRVRVICDVEGADVFKGNERLGAAGEILLLAPYVKHSLEVVAAGYKPAKITVSISAPGKQEKDQYVELKPWGAALRITAKPPDGYPGQISAEILLDGRSIGAHPLPLVWEEGLTTGPHTVAIAERPWKRVPPQQVVVEAGKPTDVHFVLDEMDSFLDFDVTPPDASIYVDGRLQKSPLVQVRPEVDHEVRIWAKNYVAYTARHKAALGETNRVPVVLKEKKRSRTLF